MKNTPKVARLLAVIVIFAVMVSAAIADSRAPERPATISETAKQERSGETIDWEVISAGGTEATSENYQIAGTSGQTAIGGGTSENYGVSQGYWQEIDEGPDFICGDADGNTIVNISDAVYLIAYIFGGGPAPDPLLSGDADCNEIVNISDTVYLIAYIFGGGPAPCAECP
jgi:hypothetical protein